MIDVVLYRHDSKGHLDLQERVFPSLLALARFFTTEGAAAWEWAEVAEIGDDGRQSAVRYSAGALRSLALGADGDDQIG